MEEFRRVIKILINEEGEIEAFSFRRDEQIVDWRTIGAIEICAVQSKVRLQLSRIDTKEGIRVLKIKNWDENPLVVAEVGGIVSKEIETVAAFLKSDPKEEVGIEIVRPQTSQ